MVLIVGLLAAMALPAYQAYATRAKVVEGLTLANPARTAVAEAFNHYVAGPIGAYAGSGPPPAGSYGFEFTPTSVVQRIRIAAIGNVVTPAAGDGVVTVDYASQVGGALGAPIILIPGSGFIGANGRPSGLVQINAAIVWGCTLPNAGGFQFVPANCRYL